MIDKCLPVVYNIITSKQTKYIGGCKNETSETTCTFEDGTIKTFSSYDKAITKLEKMGYRF